MREFHPIAVREVHLERGLTDLGGLEGYTQALVVLRRRGQPIGELLLPVRRNRVTARTIRDALPECARTAWSHLVREGHPARISRPLVSVVVCTRDRAHWLGDCLKSLGRLTWTPLEILVVDNCPTTDATRRLVEATPGVEYLRCDTPGLDNARNFGGGAARGEIVAFTDDDARVDPGWITALVMCLEDPTVAVATGVAFPLEIETPAQFLFEAAGGFRRGLLPRRLGMAHAPWAGAAGAGVNMAVRKEVFLQTGGFDPYLDGGTPTLSGGDHEFFSRVLARGHRIAYEPSACVWHLHRKESDAVGKTLFGYGVGVYAWWTRSLWVDREYGAVASSVLWFVHYHLRNLLRVLLGRSSPLPLSLVLAEMRGALWGPWAYLRSRFFSRL
ncbi:MAG: glycosyltransferase family A protein [Bacteroidota bacterium]